MNPRLRRLNAIALAVTLTYALAAVQLVSKKTIVSPVVDAIFVYVTSAGFYKLIVDVLFRAVASSQILMRIYWGRLHIAGLWSYVYTVDGSPDKTIFFGVWRFEQNLYGTLVVGFGLTDDFQVRSHVRSVTDLLENGKVCELVNVRTDSVDSRSEYYSRTTMFFELSRSRMFRRPDRMRGKTYVYGGPLTGRICTNSFLRHNDARTEQDVIKKIRANVQSHGQIHPDP